MRIVVVGRIETESFACHIGETLSTLGHDVAYVEAGARRRRVRTRLGYRWHQVRSALASLAHRVPALRRRHWRTLWQTIEEKRPELILVTHDFLQPQEVAELRRNGAAVALWFPDHLVNLVRGWCLVAPYDALFFKDPYIVRTMRRVLTTPVFYLPECFNPQRHRLPPNESENDIPAEFRCDITTAGNLHSWRLAWLQGLDAYDVKIWGDPPPLWLPLGPVRRMVQGRPVFNEDKARAFRGAKIVLNTLHFGEIEGANVRLFEAAGIGAFQLVNETPGLGSLFDVGREVITFRDLQGLRAAIAYWLPREDERRTIAQAAMARAYREHTYELRLRLLLDTLAGRERGFPMPLVEQR